MAKKEVESNLMDILISLCKRRGFIFPSSEIYGGIANTWDYGSLGVELKNNIKQEWWKRFVQQRDDMVGIDAALMMNPRVWEASGHLAHFSDSLVDCKSCKQRFRADEINGNTCPACGGKLTAQRQFNLMFKTFIGPIEDEGATVYLRPETAQAMFVDFKQVVQTMRKKIPFGIAQVGKAFRNEVTPGNYIFRTREFEQMEIEYFVHPKDWKKYFEMWLSQMLSWIEFLGVKKDQIYLHEIPEGERAHYSKRTIDIEYKYPFGQKELYGIAYRTDYDLKRHQETSKSDLTYEDPVTKERYIPHVVEPTWGVDRSVLVTLLSAYYEEIVGKEKRVVLRLPKKLAPYQVAVFPLLANKPKLVELAQGIANDLRKIFVTAWDDRGNIGKRYYSQDEIGTPYCVTVDFDSLEDKAVTVRDRDTMKQERVKIGELVKYLMNKFNF